MLRRLTIQNHDAGALPAALRLGGASAAPAVHMCNHRCTAAKGRLLACLLSAMAALLLTQLPATPCLAVSSANIPLDSPIYLYLEKLAGFGLITSDVKGLKPFSKAEAARLALEAETRLESTPSCEPSLERQSKNTAMKSLE